MFGFSLFYHPTFVQQIDAVGYALCLGRVMSYPQLG
jgi:hypothetical protein